MALTADTWPIAAALLQFPAVKRDGTVMQEADASEWVATFREVKESGFDAVDLTDSWVRAGDLSSARLDELKGALDEAGLAAPSLSAIRRSIIDAANWEENLAYSHRTLEAAAQLGQTVVSFGLHQALTPAQKEQLWFWTVEGHQDPDPTEHPEVWDAAVTRFRELGRHAEELGLLMSLEMYEDTYLGTGASSARLAEEIGLSNVGINADVGNLVRLHRPIEDWWSIFEQVLPWTNYWHVKGYQRDENVAKGLYTSIPTPMENGVINYREVFKLALEHGFQGVICAESYGGDGLSVSAANQAYLRRQVLPKQDGYALGVSNVTQRSSRVS